MSLSNDLISQFVKATKDTAKPKTESTVTGTTVKYDGRTWVQLDGSDLLTPVSTTADTVDGERVNVLIKDHTATITGNTSSPAARTETVQQQGGQIMNIESATAYKISTEQLEAVDATIDALRATTAKFDNMEAINAEIDSLEAKLIETDKLTATDLKAVNAQIEHLEAMFGEFTDISTEDLEAINANIGNLKAYTAKFTYVFADVFEAYDASIKNLDAGVAEIDTLIFGSATGTVIQTSFSNSVIAQLGDAQIKSAMIDSLVANKIVAGDINTNLVNVVSEDGRLLIADETIQIKDETRVRVQIGKDASGDYSINIWDANGKLMFSEGGITDSAIKKAIIRDDMVSDTANISAGKINITSLFEEINGSSNTIKSNRIYLDEEKQTLDLAFKSMTSDVENIDGRVTSNGTNISVIQGQISSKIWQQDIDKVSDAMSTQYSTLTQNLDGFKTEVGKTYATKGEMSAANTLIQQNTDAILLRATKTEVSENHYTKAQTESLISVSSDNILLEVGSVSEDLSDTNGEVSDLKSSIQILQDSVITKSADDNGATSTLVQNGTGWTFSLSDLENTVGEALKSIQDLSGDMTSAEQAIEALKLTDIEHSKLMDYVTIGSHNNQPCIELGEIGGEFKLRITNTEMYFIAGSTILTTVTNQKMITETMEIKTDLQFGDFYWSIRDNGNMGLIWRGGS